jgi:hypothetical protein
MSDSDRERLEEVEKQLDELEAWDPVVFGERAAKLEILFRERERLLAKMRAPLLPHFRVWDFFPGLVLRIAQDFADFDGAKHAAGEVLHFLEKSYFPYDGGHTLTFREKVIRLAEIAPQNEPVIENAGNAFFEPVTNRECLLACLRWIDEEWPLSGAQGIDAEAIGVGIQRCRLWLEKPSGPPPVCNTAEIAMSLFNQRGRMAGLGQRIALLVEGVRLCSDAGEAAVEDTWTR